MCSTGTSCTDMEIRSADYDAQIHGYNTYYYSTLISMNELSYLDPPSIIDTLSTSIGTLHPNLCEVYKYTLIHLIEVVHVYAQMTRMDCTT